MKFLIAFAAVAAVAVAVPVQRELITPVLAGPAAVVDDAGQPIFINPVIVESSPVSVGPAIVDFSPISVGPAIVEQSPISIGPAIVDFPLPDGGAVTAVEPTPVVSPSPVVVPSPVVIGDIPAGASPLVQIIVNVNQPESVVPAPVEADVVEEAHTSGPVNVVDNVIYPDVVLEPVQVVEPVIVDPVQVAQPIVVEPVQVAQPIIPIPAVVIPDILN